MTKTDTYVSVTDDNIYPARVDPAKRWNGWLSPHFTLPVVRQLAADTQKMAEETGHDCTDTVHVIDGGTKKGGEPRALVLHVRWAYMDDDGPRQAATIHEPDEDGRYAIGGCDWTWYAVEDGPLFYTQKAAYEAWKQVLKESSRRIGEILRTQTPQATSCLIDLHDFGNVVQVDGAQGQSWLSLSTDEDCPLDCETLGEADEVLRRALDHGRDANRLEIAGWRPERGSDYPELHRVVFAPLGAEPTGDGPLHEAHARATEARRKLLADSVPYLVADARAVCPEAVGVVVDPKADRPFVMFLVDNDDPATSTQVPAELAEKLHKRLEDMFAYRPTGEDLTACGWTDDAPPHLDGAYALTFPAE